MKKAQKDFINIFAATGISLRLLLVIAAIAAFYGAERLCVKTAFFKYLRHMLTRLMLLLTSKIKYLAIEAAIKWIVVLPLLCDEINGLIQIMKKEQEMYFAKGERSYAEQKR